MKKSTIIVAILLIVLIALKIYWVTTMPVISDEIGHLIYAQWIGEHHTIYLGNGEMYPHITLMYIPVFHFMLLGLLSIMPLLAVRLFLAIAVPLITTYFVWKLFYKYEPTGIVAVLMNFVPSYFTWTATSLYTEGMMVLLSVATIYYFLNNKNRWILFWTLTLLLKHYITYLIALPLAYHAFINKEWKKLGIMAAIGAVILPLQLYVFSVDKALKSLGALANIGMTAPPYIWNYNIFALFQVSVLSGLLFVIFLLPFLWSKYKFEVIWFLTYIPFLLVGIMETRRIIMISPLIFLFPYLAIGLIDVDEKIKNIIRIIAIGGLLILFLFLISYQFQTSGLPPMLVDSFNYTRSLPDDVNIFTPFAYETLYYTNKTVTVFNMDMNTNNATHIYMLTGWIKMGYWYNFVVPDINTLEGNGWHRVWEDKDSYILERDSYHK